MERARFIACALLMLCPLALTRHDDDFAFDNSEEFLVSALSHSLPTINDSVDINILKQYIELLYQQDFYVLFQNMNLITSRYRKIGALILLVRFTD